MKTSSQSKKGTPHGFSENAASKRLSQNEKKALELKEHAEHETGLKREKLQKQAIANTK